MEGVEIEPVVSVVSIEKLPITTDTELSFAPDLAVEVISTNEGWGKLEKKVLAYQKGGTRLVWAIAPVSKQVFVYHKDKGLKFEILTVADELNGEDVLPKFTMPVKELFDYPAVVFQPLLKKSSN